MLAKEFNAISVREDTAVNLCLKYLSVNAEHVLDPTMLLSRQDYIDLIQNAKVPNNSGSLFAYVLDKTSSKMSLINQIAEDRRMKPYFIDYLSLDFSKPIEQRIVPPVETWLRSFYDAEFVVTDSFHGCVFSIIFGKPFVALGNPDRGMSRFISLLKTFGLDDHLVMSVKDYNPKKSYGLSNDLNKHFTSLQDQSRSFLIHALQ